MVPMVTTRADMTSKSRIVGSKELDSEEQKVQEKRVATEEREYVRGAYRKGYGGTHEKIRHERRSVKLSEVQVEAKILLGSPVALRAQEIGQAGRDRGRGESKQHAGRGRWCDG